MKLIRKYQQFINFLLYDDNYLECIRDIILQVKKQYAVLIYNMANIHTMSDENIFFNINDQLFQETLLLERRGKHFPILHIKKKRKSKEKESVKDIKNMKENVSEDSVEELYNKYKNQKI